MGQKVNPHGLRVGVIKDWDSRWFANKSDFGDTLVEDYNVRKFIKKNLYAAGVPKIEIERFADKVRIHIHCAKPGVVIGRGGAEYLKDGRPAEYDERTWIDMLLVKHTLIAADKMKMEGDTVSGMTDDVSSSSYVGWDDDNA